jgi:hypothetical protein
MTPHYHAVVWIDHHEARIIHFNADAADEELVHPAHPPRHLHCKVGSPSGTHQRGDPAYFRAIAEAVSDAAAFIVVGPSSAKGEFKAWLEAEMPPTAKHLFAVMAAPRMTDGELITKARQYFRAADRMRPRIE